ncbi:MAG TPA: YggS family pyridoxal phosphate-dependent enzyme [Acidimicrobiales bacterium]|nr:YggS family pyridoxal phosphate-dependent enzyme [Acidimicrobiales bacterium]
MSIEQRAQAVRRRIEAAGGDDRVQLIGVTKGFGPEVVRSALDAGIVDFGESYAQEFVAKAVAVSEDGGQSGPTWHFIGRLQRNKVRSIAPWVSLWHSVDRERLAIEIAKHAGSAAVLVQVDATAEPAKGGCPPAEVAPLVKRCSELGLVVRGLMAMGHADDPDRTSEAFASTNELADRLGLVERSMGMSGDLEAAVAAGSTMVRVGTALFGPRPPRAEVKH